MRAATRIASGSSPAAPASRALPVGDASSDPAWIPHLVGFAAPVHQLDPALHDSIVSQYASRYLALFLDRQKLRLSRSSSGLALFLQAQLDAGLSYQGVWDPSFADVRRAALFPAQFKGRSATHVAAAAGLRLLADGRAGEFEADLDPAVRLRLNRWVLPAGERMTAEGDGRSIELRFAAGSRRRKVSFQKERGRWNADGAQELPAFTLDRASCVLLEPPALPAAYPAPAAHKMPAIPRNEILRSGRGAVAVLRRHSPRYLPWVDRVLRAIIPCEGSHARLRSGSDFDQPGAIQVSFPAPAAALAEMLVHESSHLTYQIATRLGDVDDGSDQALYFSPVKQTGRPIDRILLAYHAFANVLLFYRDCQATGIDDDGYCERNERATIPQLELLEEPLLKTKALTPIGRALFHPLRDLIR